MHLRDADAGDALSAIESTVVSAGRYTVEVHPKLPDIPTQVTGPAKKNSSAGWKSSRLSYIV